MIASWRPVATFRAVRSRPHASMMARASETTPAGVMSVHPQPLPEAPDGEGGAEGDEADGEAACGVDEGGECQLARAAEWPAACGCCVTH
nr:MAG TPA: hypothetical protein [Caudoviricetes sp.]